MADEVRTAPHMARLARLLHNRVVRRILSSHPTAELLLLVGDLVDGVPQLRPAAVWEASGRVIAEAGDHSPAELGRWRAMSDDLRPEFALLSRVCPVELFAPYLLELRQLDMRLPDDGELEDVQFEHVQIEDVPEGVEVEETD
jgi:hypothetical protein